MQVGAERMKDGSRIIKEVRDDDNCSPAFEKRVSTLERVGDARRISRAVVFQEMHQVLQVCCRAAGRDVMADFFVKDLQ